MELTHESVNVQLDFMFEETVLKCLFTRIGTGTIEQSAVLGKIFSYSFYLKYVKVND